MRFGEYSGEGREAGWMRMVDRIWNIGYWIWDMGAD
jgi:hypothetical protein